MVNWADFSVKNMFSLQNRTKKRKLPFLLVILFVYSGQTRIFLECD